MITEKILHQYTCSECGHFWITTPENSLSPNCVECPVCSLEPLVYKTYDNLMESIFDNGSANACRRCSNHPANGGSGICHCILGSNIFY